MSILNLIKENPTNIQQMINNRYYLMALLLVQEPIKYVEYNGEKYVVDGHHRLLAAKQLHLSEIPIQQVSLPYSGYKTFEDLQWLIKKGDNMAVWQFDFLIVPKKPYLKDKNLWKKDCILQKTEKDMKDLL